MTINIEDAGFEIRDQIMWLFGSGFPKSLNIAKKLNSDLSKKWQGWGTALKPAHEPICLARKPISEKTIAKNVLKWDTGGINIDGCRIPINPENENDKKNNTNIKFKGTSESEVFKTIKNNQQVFKQKRYPANLIHDGSDDVINGFPKTKIGGGNKSNRNSKSNFGVGAKYDDIRQPNFGNASRYFYCAKASKSEKNEGLENFQKKQKVFNGQSNKSSKELKDVEKRFTTQPTQNIHTTVKPIKLMKYLCRLITPPNGIILDPFMGSGSTGISAILEGFNFIGIELEKDYFEIAKARIYHHENKIKQLNLFENK